MERRMHPAEDDQLTRFFARRGVDMDSHHAVFETIRAASLMVAAMEDRSLRPLRLTHAGYRVLCELWIKGPLELRNLAAFMMVSRPSIVGTVDTLEANGLVARARSSADRRLVTVALTDEGLSLIDRADVAWHECQVQVVSGLTSADKRRLAELSRMLTTAALKLQESTMVRP